MLLYQPLYTNTGSFIGTLSIAADANHTVTGAVTWSRAAQTTATDNTFKAGWATPIALTVSAGGLYTAPSTGVFLGLSVGTVDNAKITFSGGGLAGAARQPTLNSLFLKKSTPAAVITITNLAKTTLTTTIATGAFNGTFTLVDDDPTSMTMPKKQITRSVTYQGLAVPGAPVGSGSGYFLLTSLPASGSTVLPVLSGKVVLEMKP